jgi:transcriptional antiterminator NusG
VLKLDNFLDNWYALYVKTGEEERVKTRLEYRFSDEVAVIVPKRRLKIRKAGKWRECIKPLYPGYVLVNGNFNVDQYYKTKSVPGLLRVLKSGKDPVKVPLDEIEFITKLFQGTDTIDVSDVLFINGRVVVTDGPLTSLEGNIVNINRRKGRAKVKLKFLGEERLVDLGINLLAKI